jgi:hypothetical protein
MSFKFFQSRTYQRQVLIDKLHSLADTLWITSSWTHKATKWSEFSYMLWHSKHQWKKVVCRLYEDIIYFGDWRNSIKKVVHSWFSFSKKYSHTVFFHPICIQNNSLTTNIPIPKALYIFIVFSLILYISGVYRDSYDMNIWMVILLIGIGYIIYMLRVKYSRTYTIAMDSISFEWNFDVHSDNEVYARLILTPAILERLHVLSQSLPQKVKLLVYLESNTCTIKFDCSRLKSLWAFSHTYTPFTNVLPELLKASHKAFDVLHMTIPQNSWRNTYTQYNTSRWYKFHKRPKRVSLFSLLLSKNYWFLKTLVITFLLFWYLNQMFLDTILDAWWDPTLIVIFMTVNTTFIIWVVRSVYKSQSTSQKKMSNRNLLVYLVTFLKKVSELFR